MRVPRESLVMAVDGTHCIVYRNEGNARTPRLVVIEAARRVMPEIACLHVDTQGRHLEAEDDDRTHGASDGLAEWRFLMAAAALLDDMAEQGAPYLILVAPASILGTVLARLGRAASGILIGTVEGRSMQLGADEITELLAAAP